jgi:hypothetical protein
MKFKELVSKLNEKATLETGTPETTKEYADATPGQGNVVFTPDPAVDGVAIANKPGATTLASIKNRAAESARMKKENVSEASGFETNHDEFAIVGDRATPVQIKKVISALDDAAKRAIDKRGVVNSIFGKQSNGDLARKAFGAQVLSKNIQRNINAKLGTSDRKELGQHLVYAASLLKSINEGVSEDVSEAVDHREFASQGKMHPDMSKYMKAGQETDFYHSKTGDKISGKVIKNTGTAVHIQANKNGKVGGGETHKFDVSKTIQEAKDEREYGYEGDMAISQLKTITRHADHMMGMLKPETDLPEWVQSKITLATDYMQTAHDYMMSEMTESYDGRVLGRITSKEINKVLGPTKNAAQGIEALKKAFKVTDAQAKMMLNTVMKESVEQIDESEDKTISRLKQLVRFGLMDKSKLSILSRSIKSLEKGQVTNPTERATLFELLNELIGLVTGDDAMFAKVRMNVQRPETQIRNEEAELNTKD